MEILYEINQLKVGYRPNKIVLEIDEMKIPKGEVVFVLGASGVGKSTLLETLGLMNDTFVDTDDNGQLWFEPLAKNTRLSIQKLWSQNEADRSFIRAEYMSFIFQRSFLLPNFTAGENMMLKSLYRGHNAESVKNQIQGLMEELDLDWELFSRSVNELSGGQQQRVAFIQAFVSSYQILFADEPTGNLDPATAANLMKMLVDHIHQKNKTCIVVSHDIRLARTFGDRIFVLSHKQLSDTNRIGQLLAKHEFEKQNENWTNIANEEVDIIKEVQKIYTNTKNEIKSNSTIF